MENKNSQQQNKEFIQINQQQQENEELQKIDDDNNNINKQEINENHQKTDLEKQKQQQVLKNMNKTINLTFEKDKKELMEKFDPLQRPFNLQDAMLHNRANKIYKPISDSALHNLDIKQQTICYCCGKLEKGEQYSLGVDTLELSQMGPIIPLYFQFIRYGAGFMLVIFLVSGIITLIESIEGNKCLNMENDTTSTAPLCSTLFSSLSSYNVNHVDPDNPITKFNFALMFVLMIYNLVYNRQMAKLKYQIDKKVCSPSDYTVTIKNVPHGKNVKFNKEDFKKQIQDLSQKANEESKNNKIVDLNIDNISFSYNLQEIQNFEKKYNEIKQAQLLNDQKTLDKYQIQENEVEEKLLDLKQQMLQYKQNLISSDSLENCSGTAFITFSSEQEKVHFLNYFQKRQKRSCHNYCMSNTGIFLEKDKQSFQINCLPAQEPKDVIWQNLEIEYRVKQKQRMITYGKTFVFLFVITAIIFVIQYIQHIKSVQSDQVLELILSIVVGIAIAAANFILSIYLYQLCEIESWSSHTNFYISLTLKTTVSSFINTTLITLILKLILKNKDIHISGGLITTVSTIFITNSIIPPLLEIFDVYSFMTWFWQNRYKQKSWQAYINQKDANLVFQDRKMDYSSKFSRNMNTMLLGTFYSYLIPLGPLICFFDLFITFFADKYGLLRKQSIPLPVGSELMQKMVSVFWDYLIVFQAAGQVIFQAQIYGSVHYLSIIQLCMSLAFSFLPIQKFLYELIQSKTVKDNYVEQQSFQKAKEELKFDTDYQRENPITKQKQIELYFQFMQEQVDLKRQEKKQK